MRLDPGGMMDRLNRWRKDPQIQQRFRILGLVALVAGVLWALATLDLDWADLSWMPLAVNALVLTPALLVLAAVTFRVTAASADMDISLVAALRTVAHANVAELLPLPGGAIVRGAALMGGGVGASLATQLVILTALLTLGLAVTVSAVALTLLAHPGWGWLVAATVIGLIVVLALLARHARPTLLLAMVGLRLISLGVTAGRLVLAFAALGQVISWLQGALFASAPTLGAAVGIFPAGLGINEAIAAGLATLVSASPATAFLAVALNRVLGLSVGALIVFLHALTERQNA